MRALTALWADESGLILSAEAVTLGTLGVVGAVVGLNAVARSANSELEEFAFALRSLDQSYTLPARESHGARTAGSSFKQMSVKKAHAALRKQIERDRRQVQEELERRDDRDDDRDDRDHGKPRKKGSKSDSQRSRDDDD